MRGLNFFIIVCFFVYLVGCSVEINPSRCEINIKQGNVNIPCNTGYFDFGNIPLDLSQTITFTIENTGCDYLFLLNQPPVSISGVNKGDFSVLLDTTIRLIAPETSKSFAIKFQPTELGNRKATVNIHNNDGDEDPYTFIVVGNCTQPAPEIHVRQDTIDILNTTGSYNFGLVNVYDCSKPITFTIENNGSKNLNLTGDPEKINISGLDKSMFIGDYSLTQTTISSGNSTSFTVMFNPSSPGIKKSKVSILNDDGDENPYTFILLGTGVAVPEISVSQGTTDITSGLWTYDFDTVLIYESSPEVIFTIKNIGTSALHLSDAPNCVKILGADPTMFFVNQSSINETLQIGESTSFSLKFLPTSPGQKTATISIANNDEDENPFTFTLTGKCVEPEINVKQGTTNIPNSTGTFDFGLVNIGNSSSDITFTIENLRTGDLKLTGSPKIGISGTGAAMYSINQSSTTSPIHYGSSTTFTIRYSPTSTGKISATISISNNDVDENPYTFEIVGYTVDTSSGNAIGWIGGGSNGWKTIVGTGKNSDYKSFRYPNGIAIDFANNIYIVDFNNHRICKWDANGNAIGWIGGGIDGWQTTSAPSDGCDFRSFSVMYDVFIDSSGFIYVADGWNHRVSKWDANGNAIGWIGGGSNGWKTGTAPPDAGDYQSFGCPSGVFVDDLGYIYVTDYTFHRICKWDSSGNAIGWIGGGSNGWKTIDGSSMDWDNDYQSFNQPRDIVVDSVGNLYIGDVSNNRICKWDANGNAIGWIGGGSDGWKTSDSGSGVSGSDYQRFNNACGLSVTKTGILYVADNSNDRICKWDVSGNAIGWIGGGSNGWKTASGSTDDNDYQSFDSPMCVATDRFGNIYIADYNNHRICKWSD